MSNTQQQQHHQYYWLRVQRDTGIPQDIWGDTIGCYGIPLGIPLGDTMVSFRGNAIERQDILDMFGESRDRQDISIGISG